MCNDKLDCECCYCVEKRHKIKKLLKPKKPKFKGLYDDPGQNNSIVVFINPLPENDKQYYVDSVNKSDPYEFKYDLVYGSGDNRKTISNVSESLLKERVINYLYKGRIVEFINGTQWKIIKEVKEDGELTSKYLAHYIDDDTLVHLFEEHELNQQDKAKMEKEKEQKVEVQQDKEDKQSPAKICGCYYCRHCMRKPWHLKLFEDFFRLPKCTANTRWSL